MKLALPLLFLGAALAGSGVAQNIDWATFSKDNARLSAAASLGVNDVQEKDYDWADLDKDGWTDLVVVRKQPFTTAGMFQNVLFMNEGGVLVDRTADYAFKSDVGGDMGFLTPTNDRDVVISDIDLDGWLDVITAPAFSPGEPKHVSHPRIYYNLGNDAGGHWLGLEAQHARFPDWGVVPSFCGVDAGDVTGDGYPDLYFSHYLGGAVVDLDDRLLVNDGTGFFNDETAARLTPAMTLSGFGTSTTIVDLNGDGAADIVDGESFVVNVLYNDPAQVGFFNILDNPYFGAPYHANSGDLNRDGKADLMFSDDGLDRYLLNEGNDGLGRVVWSPPHAYNTDDGFASNVIAADVDGDGWPETIHCDVDVDIPGCDRRMHLYHNRGGTVGGFVSLVEEAGSGFTGVTGVKTNDLRGMHDIAVFDIDNDGDNDMVMGRCSGTSLWLNQADPQIGVPYCDPSVANSAGLSARILAIGSDVVADQSFTLTATDLPANKFGYFLVSDTQGFIANPGGSQGNLCLGGTIGRYNTDIKSSSTGGAFSLTIDLTLIPPPVNVAVQPGDTWNFTAWYRDNNPSPTSNFTDAISVVFN